MNILITGASGFIGTNLLDFYLSKGYEVINIDFSKPKNKQHLPYWKNVDIRNHEQLEKIVLDFVPDYIVHLAARTDLDGNKLDDYDSNLIGTENISEISKKCHNLKRIIFTSSQLVCKGRMSKDDNDYYTVNAYGESKKQNEIFIKNAKNIQYEWLIVRPTSIWGPWFEAPYYNFFKMIMAKQYFHIGRKSGVKTCGYVGNVVYQLDKLLFAESQKVCNQIFYLGDIEPYNIEEWANEIAKELKTRIKRCPIFVLKLLSIIGDILAKMNIRFPITNYRLHNMTSINLSDVNKIYHIAPNPPYSRINGIRITLDWINWMKKNQQ
jgi:nucleoside-diphosphate-sugar epimerase